MGGGGAGVGRDGRLTARTPCRDLVPGRVRLGYRVTLTVPERVTL